MVLINRIGNGGQTDGCDCIIWLASAVSKYMHCCIVFCQKCLPDFSFTTSTRRGLFHQKPLFADAARSITLCVRLHAFDGCLTGIQSVFDAARGTLKSRPRRSQDTNYRHAAAGDQSKARTSLHHALITDLHFSGRVERSICNVSLFLCLSVFGYYNFSK